MRMGYFCPFSVQYQFGVIWCTCLEVAVNTKKNLGLEQNGLKFGTLIRVKHKWSDFDLVAFNVILGVIRCICLSYYVKQKASRRAKLSEI